MKVRAPNIHPFAANGHFSLYYRPFFSLSSYTHWLYKWGKTRFAQQHVSVRHACAMRSIARHKPSSFSETGWRAKVRWKLYRDAHRVEQPDVGG